MDTIVIIATFGRKGLANVLLGHLERQTRRPLQVIVSAPDESHVEPYAGDVLDVRFVYGQAGLCRQRNRALDAALGHCDVVCFFDDDFIPADDYVQRLEEGFSDHPDWASLTGHVLRDGVTGESITFEKAVALVQQPFPGAPVARDNAAGAYGCNMAFRAASIGDMRFDERLAMYGWQEDVDFSRRILARGRTIWWSALRGVHMGVKGGRSSGTRLGYSQVVNPIYLLRKGSVTLPFAAQLILRNMLANMAKSFRPEPWIDRRGRLRGNLLAWKHIASGKVDPEYILNL